MNMKEYLLLFRGGDARTMLQSPENFQEHMHRWMQWMGELTKDGTFVAAQPLNQTGMQITGKNKVITDGPYIEGKEIVGGYLICKANDYPHALEIAKGCPILEFEDGIVEVREIQELTM
jgi:hypothetical protein